MTTYRSVFTSSITAWWCCPDCDAVRLCCPGCSEWFRITRPDDRPPALPFHSGIRCPDPDCDALLALTVCGYRPNPTGDAPANRSPLSDPLPVIERPRPPAPPRALPAPPPPSPPQRTQAQAHVARSLARQGYINPRLDMARGPLPCPPDAPRRRAIEWAAVGVLPPGVEPSALAAAFRRRFGVGARRDPKRKTGLAYTFRELGMALGQMGLAPAAEPAPGWEVAL